MQRFTEEDIRWLASLLQSEGLEEIEVQEGEEAVVVSAPKPVTRVMPQAGPGPNHPVVAALGKDVIPVLSPMPGVFYRSSSPGASPFVQVGDVVESGDTVGLIEAMKLFNEVTAPAGGTIAQIMVANEQAIEADQALMTIRLAAQ